MSRGGPDAELTSVPLLWFGLRGGKCKYVSKFAFGCCLRFAHEVILNSDYFVFIFSLFSFVRLLLLRSRS